MVLKEKAIKHVNVDIVVIGGGMVGLTLALSLGSAGLSVNLIDPSKPSWPKKKLEDGRTTAISAGSQKIFESLNVWGDIKPHAQAISEIRVSDARSSLFLHYHHADLGKQPLGHIVENKEIKTALLAKLATSDSVSMSFGSYVEKLHRDENHVIAMTSGGTKISATLAIATDGRNSPTREGAKIAKWEKSYKQTAIVCTVRHEKDHKGIAQEQFLASGPFAILPMTENRSSIVWTERNDLAQHILSLGDLNFLQELELRFGDYLGSLGVVGPKFFYPLSVLHAATYVAPRLALAGDAAHAIHPVAGQGFNISLFDVAALAELVVDSRRLGLDFGSALVLGQYEKWRRFDNTLMLGVTDVLNSFFSNDHRTLRIMRDTGLFAVNKVIPVKKMSMLHAMGMLGRLPKLVRGERL
ncbi:MAG: UbiH/UbiF/VisC/COQ6 family ubiquinone biosynthesis hydroxylase [Pseudomonadota bacterium]|nr:UbiH/UbiF/VisC/COQ6 family ubiquinone biosynthesis hydroxylase [Pseudomonadota bacterium]